VGKEARVVASPCSLTLLRHNTLAAKYQTHDAAQCLRRQIICYNKDAKEIYYDVEPIVIVEERNAESSPVPPASSAPAEGAAVPVVVLLTSSGPAAPVTDESVQAVDIVRSLIVQKRKKTAFQNSTPKCHQRSSERNDLVNGKI